MPTVEEMMAWDSWDWHEYNMKPHGNFTRLEQLSRKLQEEADRAYDERQSRQADSSKLEK